MELAGIERTLAVLAASVLKEQPPLRRFKIEHLVSGSGCRKLQLDHLN